VAGAEHVLPPSTAAVRYFEQRAVLRTANYDRKIGFSQEHVNGNWPVQFRIRPGPVLAASVAWADEGPARRRPRPAEGRTQPPLGPARSG
jgi:hypothetical protein